MTRCRPRRRPFLLFLFLSSFFLFSPFNSKPLYAEEPGIIVSLSSGGAGQGGVTVIEVFTTGGAEPVRGSFNGREVFFYNAGGGVYRALLGVDLEASPEKHRVEVSYRGEGTEGTISISLRVSPRGFGTQKLTLPRRMVDLDEAALERVAREKKRMEEVYSMGSSEKLWEGGFESPVGGRVTGGFGVRRVLNGEPRSPHAGVDIAASAGTEVLAANRGRVVLAEDHYFSGLTVVLDHGMGLFTMYAHLSEIKAVEGEVVEKGGVVGLVGSTGRSTGPHLHWGVRLNDARVDPLELISATRDIAIAEGSAGKAVAGGMAPEGATRPAGEPD